MNRPTESIALPRTVPADLLAVAMIGGNKCHMRGEEIGRDHLLLRGQRYVRPLTEVELVLWPEFDKEPLYAVARVQYIEKSWAGYVVDLSLDRMARGDRDRWERTWREAVLASPSTPGANDPATALRSWQPQVLVLGTAMSPQLRGELRTRGLRIEQALTGQGLRARLRERPDLVIADAGSPLVTPALLKQLGQAGSDGPELILLTEYATEPEIEAHLSAGVGRVIVKPCDPETLIGRILTALGERSELRTAAYASSTTLPPARRAEERRPRRAAPGFFAILRRQIESLVGAG